MADSPFFPSRQRGRAAFGLPNDNLQQMAQMLQRRNEMGQTPPTPPVTVTNPLNPGTGLGGMVGQAVGQGIAATPPTSAPAPVQTAAAAPPPVSPPGDQSLPSTMTQSATAADAMNPVANGPNTPGFWERINRALAAQQVPDGYRGAMGEMIKNG